MQRALRPFFRETTPVIRDSVRPLVRATRPVVDRAAPGDPLAVERDADLFSTLRVAQPLRRRRSPTTRPGEEEGYLFWLSWANHLGANVFNIQDAHGPIRRGRVVVGCDALAILDNVAAVNEVLGTTIGLINLPRTSSVCGQAQGQTRIAGMRPSSRTGPARCAPAA